MASVHSHPLSRFWQASISIWDAKAGRMKRTFRSTKVPITESRDKAVLVAQELEDAGRAGRQFVTREDFQRRLSSIMRLAGVEPPVKVSCWAEFSADWLERSLVGETTRPLYRRQISLFSEWLGPRSQDDMRRISAEDLATFQVWSRKRWGGHAVSALMTRIRAIFHQAVSLGYLETNPMSQVRVASEKRVIRRPFTLDEIRLLLNHLEDPVRRKFRIPVLFGLYYGMRISDALARSFEEIHDGLITFIVQKTKQRITLPLIGELAGLSGKGPISPGIAPVTLSVYFQKFLDDAGISVKREARSSGGVAFSNLTFHSLRHTSATFLAEAGVDLKVRQLILGHSTAAMAVHYTHSSMASIKAALEKVHGDANPPASSATHESVG